MSLKDMNKIENKQRVVNDSICNEHYKRLLRDGLITKIATIYFDRLRNVPRKTI